MMDVITWETGPKAIRAFPTGSLTRLRASQLRNRNGPGIETRGLCRTFLSFASLQCVLGSR